jgi:hypothetical protein
MASNPVDQGSGGVFPCGGARVVVSITAELWDLTP